MHSKSKRFDMYHFEDDQQLKAEDVSELYDGLSNIGIPRVHRKSSLKTVSALPYLVAHVDYEEDDIFKVTETFMKGKALPGSDVYLSRFPHHLTGSRDRVTSFGHQRDRHHHRHHSRHMLDITDGISQNGYKDYRKDKQMKFYSGPNQRKDFKGEIIIISVESPRPHRFPKKHHRKGKRNGYMMYADGLPGEANESRMEALIAMDQSASDKDVIKYLVHRADKIYKRNVQSIIESSRKTEKNKHSHRKTRLPMSKRKRQGFDTSSSNSDNSVISSFSQQAQKMPFSNALNKSAIADESKFNTPFEAVNRQFNIRTEDLNKSSAPVEKPALPDNKPQLPIVNALYASQPSTAAPALGFNKLEAKTPPQLNVEFRNWQSAMNTVFKPNEPQTASSQLVRGMFTRRPDSIAQHPTINSAILINNPLGPIKRQSEMPAKNITLVPAQVTSTPQIMVQATTLPKVTVNSDTPKENDQNKLAADTKNQFSPSFNEPMSTTHLQLPTSIANQPGNRDTMSSELADMDALRRTFVDKTPENLKAQLRSIDGIIDSAGRESPKWEPNQSEPVFTQWQANNQETSKRKSFVRRLQERIDRKRWGIPVRRRGI